MSNKRLTAVWEHSRQKGTKLLALLSLADRSDDDGFCWPSHQDTAQRARSKRTYILSVLRDIESAGELFVHCRPGNTHQYLVLPGMTFAEITKALAKRFNMEEDEIQEAIKSIANNNGVSFTDMSDLHNNRVSVLQTSGVSSTEHEPSVTPKKPKVKPVIEIPEKLNTPEFVAAWDEFQEHRKQKRQKVTSLAAKKLFNKFLEYPPERNIAAINDSIMNGYTGVFPENPKYNGGNGASGKSFDEQLREAGYR